MPNPPSPDGGRGSPTGRLAPRLALRADWIPAYAGMTRRHVAAGLVFAVAEPPLLSVQQPRNVVAAHRK